MTVPQAIGLGVVANDFSKKIVGSSEVSVGRTVVATGTGVAIGAAASGALVVAGAAVGIAAAPIVVPLAIATGVVSFVASWFD